MIIQGTYLNVVDNSGAKNAYCIKIIKGYKNRYAFLGDIILVSITRLRPTSRSRLHSFAQHSFFLAAGEYI